MMIIYYNFNRKKKEDKKRLKVSKAGKKRTKSDKKRKQFLIIILIILLFIVPKSFNDNVVSQKDDNDTRTTQSRDDSSIPSENLFPYSEYKAQDITIMNIENELITNERYYGNFIVFHFISNFNEVDNHFVMQANTVGWLIVDNIILIIIDLNINHTTQALKDWYAEFKKSNPYWNLSFAYDNQFQGNYTYVIGPKGEILYTESSPIYIDIGEIKLLIEKY